MVLSTLAFKRLSVGMPVAEAAAIVGFCCLGLALWALLGMQETFSKDLNYHEID